MTGVANGDGTAPAELFGVGLPSGTGAAGSAPPRNPSPGVPITGMSGIPNTGVSVELSFLADHQGADTTDLPGQNDDGLTGITRDEITQTGAGQGNTQVAHDRYAGQQPPAGITE